MSILALPRPVITPSGIELSDVSYLYAGGNGIHHVSLHLGETCVALAGDNGSGKSTLLRLLCGILRPQAGEIRWDGHDSKWFRRRGAGYMPDSGEDDPQFSLRQTVNFWTAQWLPPGQRQHATATGLEAAGLEPRGDELAGAQSFGNKRRLLWAAAVAHSPQFLFLDEPTAGLDEKSIGLLAELIKKRQAKGQMTVFASNDLAFIRRVAGTVIPLQAGRIADPKVGAAFMAADPYIARISTDEGERTVGFQSASELADTVRDLADARRLATVQLLPASGNSGPAPGPAGTAPAPRTITPPGPLRRWSPATLCGREIYLALASPRRLLLKMLIPLVLTLPLLLGHAPSFWASTLLSVLVCMVGCVGTAVGFAHARQGMMLARLRLAPKPAPYLLLTWMAGIVAVDLLQLCPSLLVIGVNSADGAALAVLLISVTAALMTAATLGALVSALAVNIGELLVDSVIFLAPLLFLAGIFTGVPHAGWRHVAALADPFTYLHESLVVALGGVSDFPASTRVLAALCTMGACAAISGAISRRTLR